MLHFGHRHVFRTHHHGNATGESVGRNLVNGVPPRGPSFRANNIVFYPRTISSSGRFYENSTDMLGMTPSQYRAGGTKKIALFRAAADGPG